MKPFFTGCLCTAIVLFQGVLYADDIFKNVIKMNSSEYTEHHKSIVVFPHLKHTGDFDISCGACHHDDSGEPINNLEIGDEVNRCIECHYHPTYITGKSYSEQLAFHTNTLHLKCKSCHRAENEKRNTSNSKKTAPVKCIHCH